MSHDNIHENTHNNTPDTIVNLQNIIRSFCQEREWDQFHTAKDLAIGMSTESNELLDLFRFKTDEEILQKMKILEFKEKVSYEVADIFFFILRFSDKFDIDLEKSLLEKIKLNATKYPVEQAKGSNKKYNEIL